MTDNVVLLGRCQVHKAFAAKTGCSFMNAVTRGCLVDCDCSREGSPDRGSGVGHVLARQHLEG